MDGGHVRALARRVEQVGHDVRAAGAALVAAEGVRWVSVAAEEFRGRLVTERGRVDAAVGLVDDAVAALLRHAVAVDRAASPAALGGALLDEVLR